MGVGGAVATATIGPMVTATPTTIGPITVRASAFGSASKGVYPRSAGFLLEPIGFTLVVPQDWIRSRWTPRKPVADPDTEASEYCSEAFVLSAGICKPNVSGAICPSLS